MVRDEITLGDSNALGELSQRVGDGIVAARNESDRKAIRECYPNLLSSVGEVPPNLNRHETRKFLAQQFRKSRKDK